MDRGVHRDRPTVRLGTDGKPLAQASPDRGAARLTQTRHRLGQILLLSEADTGSLAPIGAGLAAGVATSNLIDSLRHRGTVDYLVIGSRIVNLPDIAITAGLIALTADVLI